MITFHQKFSNFIDITDYQKFISQLCKNVLIYQNNVNAINKIKEEFEDAIKKRDYETNF
jgi:uncharacterized protein YihD (DUF1040 family)